jgi:transcriptional regulator with XRE-family HTH domain
MLYYVSMDRLIEKLEEYRLENRITQKELAALLKTTYPTINRWFNGKTLPNKIHQYHIKKFINKMDKNDLDKGV